MLFSRGIPEGLALRMVGGETGSGSHLTQAKLGSVRDTRRFPPHEGGFPAIRVRLNRT